MINGRLGGARRGAEGDQDAGQQDEGPHVLADAEEQHAAEDHPAPGPPIDRVDHDSDQREGEGDLVEVEVHRPLQRPAEPVQQRHHERARAAEAALGEPGDRHHRGGEERSLREQQHPRVVPDPVERGEHRDQRVEVVAEQVVPGGLERRHGSLEPGVRPDRLVEEPQVVVRRLVVDVPQPRVRAVRGEDEQAERRQHPPVGAGRPGRARRRSTRPDRRGRPALERRRHDAGTCRARASVVASARPPPLLVTSTTCPGRRTSRLV